MKKITYTSMRTELSDVLDALRAGEEIIITQKGKEDITLKGSIDFQNEKKSPNKNFHVNLNPDVIKGIKEMNKVNNQINAFLNSPEVKQKIETLNRVAFNINKVSDEFKEALLYTQIKHADIIKKLEDK